MCDYYIIQVLGYIVICAFILILSAISLALVYFAYECILTRLQASNYITSAISKQCLNNAEKCLHILRVGTVITEEEYNEFLDRLNKLK